MEKIKKIGIFLGVLAVLLIGFALYFLNSSPKAYASQVEITTELKGSYFVGEELSVPQEVEVKFEDNSVQTASNPILILPNGTAKTIENGYIFTTQGLYKIVYKTTVGGKLYTATKTISVNTNSYETSFGKSTAVFKKADQIKNGDKMGKNGALKADGIEISLAEGDTFVFNRPININELAKNNNGIIEICNIYPNLDPNKNETGIVDAQMLVVRLVDYYDNTNFLDFYCWTNNDYPQWYTGAGGSNQKLTGLHAYAKDSRDDAFYLEGYNGYFVKPISTSSTERYGLRNTFGCYTYRDTDAVYLAGGVRWTWNLNNNEIKTNASNDSKTDPRFNGFDNNGMLIVTDLDNENIYPKNPFKGFTNGDVIVEIQAFGYSVSKLNFQVTSILGLSGEELKDDKVIDQTNPIVNLNVENTDLNGINLEKNREYSLPSATVLDVNSLGKYEVSVYYDYKEKGEGFEGVKVFVKDGKFTPLYNGRYTAVYTATDKFGNVGSAKLNMNVKSGKAFSYDKTNITSFYACADNVIPQITPYDIFNKNVTSSVTIISPNGQSTEITNTLNGGYHYTPDCLGEHTIIYTFADNVYSEVYSYKINATDNGSVYFKDSLPFADVMIKNGVYDLDDYFAYTVSSSGLIASRAQLLYSENGVDFNKIQNENEFTVSSNNLYVKASLNGKESQVKEIKVVDVNINGANKYYEKYFVGASSEKAQRSYTEYEFSGTNATESLRFANTIVYKGFVLDFEIPENNCKFNQFVLNIKEVGGNGNGYKLIYSSLDDNGNPLDANKYVSKIVDNNGKQYSYQIVTGKLTGQHSLEINSENGSIIYDGVTSYLPELETRTVQFGFEFNGVTQAFKFNVIKVCNQPFNDKINSNRDKIVELVYNVPEGSKSVGSTHELPFFNVNSVFYPVSLENLTIIGVYDAQGNLINDTAGNQISMVKANNGVKFNLSEITTYTVVFEFSTANCGSMDLESIYSVTSTDETAPEIKFENGIGENTLVTTKVGEKHTLKSFEVTDNFTTLENLEIRVVVYDRFYNILAIDVSEYLFNVAGEYKVYVICFDEGGNYTTAYYNVKAV